MRGQYHRHRDHDPNRVRPIASNNGAAPFCQLRGVAKRYGGVTALDNVDFACRRGTIHAILGENGAGKSTLIKILAGVVTPSSGEVLIEGRRRQFRSPQDATARGIVCIFQELSLAPDLSVADNICITDPPRNRLGLIDKRAQARRARELLRDVGCDDLHPQELVKNLSLSRRQLVEIAKALNRDPQLLILDEATSALTAADVEHVYTILRRLRDRGLALLYISHRMHEIAELADVCSVFRNGRHIETFAQGSKTDDQIVQLMIGRELTQVYPPKLGLRPRDNQPPALAVDKLGWGRRLSDISFTVNRGEIVGLGGLDGQGQRELLLALFGVLRGVKGTITVNGQRYRPRSPRAAKTAGVDMALIPEDRKTEGLLLPMSVRDNLSLAALGRIGSGLAIDRRQENTAITAIVDKLAIKTGSLTAPVATLSGGNQQKVVIGKWLLTDAQVILLNDPTRGIDVGTKQEIYRLLRELANGDGGEDRARALLFYSTDYDELIGCCDRVIIMYDGRLTRTLSGDEINERNIVASSLNVELSTPAAYQ